MPQPEHNLPERVVDYGPHTWSATQWGIIGLYALAFLLLAWAISRLAKWQ